MIVSPADLLLVERVRTRSPAAVELALLASLAVTIEPGLLRSLRLGLLPHLGVTSEVDLWLSPLVEARSGDGIVLRSMVVHLLRQELEAKVPKATIAEAWSVIQRHHASLSPAIRREEELAWWALNGERAEIDGALRGALRTMVEEPDRNLSAWWVRARERLPGDVLNSDVAASLDRRAIEASSQSLWATKVSEPDVDEDRILHLRRRQRGLEIGYFAADDSTVAIAVPDVEPTRVEISWIGSEEAPTVLAIPAGGSVSVGLKTPAVRLKTERGELYDVALDSGPPTGPEIVLLAELFAAVQLGVRPAETDVERGLAIRAWVEEYVDPPWRRGLRSVGTRLGVPADATFSTFARVAIDDVLGKLGRRDKRRDALATMARRLIEHLPAYDDWDQAGASGPPDWRRTVDLARRFRQRFEPVVGPSHELRHLGLWIERQVSPSWAHPGGPTLPDQISEASRWPGAVDHEVMSGPVTPAALDYLLRLWPDLDAVARLDCERFRLVSDGRVACDLGRWLGDLLEQSIRRLMTTRSTTVGRTVTVGGADGDYARISDAVSAAGIGGIILIRPGTYHDHVQLLRRQQLIGPAPGEDEAIIDGEGQGAVVSTAAGCVVRNLTICRGGAETGVVDCGVLVEDCSDVVVDHCLIVDNGHYGVVLRRCEARLESNTIRANAILGIYADEGAKAVIRSNLFLDHRHSALDVMEGIEGELTNCTVIRCGDSITCGTIGPRMPFSITRNIFVDNRSVINAPVGSFEAVEHNLFYGNEHNGWDWAKSRELELGPTNFVSDPGFVDPGGGDFRLGPRSPAVTAEPGGYLGALPPVPPADGEFRGSPVSDPTLDLVMDSHPFVGEPFDYDVFISHASEDKEFVRPLARALADAGLGVWFDELELTLGDSLRRQIDLGLARSRFGIVVLSPAFFAKDWPQKELDALDSREVDDAKVILPIWHGVTQREVAAHSPLLAGRLAVSSDTGLDHVVHEVLRAVASSPARTDSAPSRDIRLTEVAEPFYSRILFESFDATETIAPDMRGTWLTTEQPQWRTTIGDGRLRWQNENGRNQTLQGTLNYVIDGGSAPLGDSRVEVKVRVGPPNDGNSAAGLIFRFDPEHDRGYAFLLQPGDAVTLFEREGDAMRRGRSLDVTPDANGLVLLRAEGTGSSTTFTANGSQISVRNPEWLVGRPGLMAYSIGTFEFDDFALYLRLPAADER